MGLPFRGKNRAGFLFPGEGLPPKKFTKKKFFFLFFFFFWWLGGEKSFFKVGEKGAWGKGSGKKSKEIRENPFFFTFLGKKRGFPKFFFFSINPKKPKKGWGIWGRGEAGGFWFLVKNFKPFFFFFPKGFVLLPKKLGE